MTTNIEPTVQPVIERPKWALTDYAERLNGRGRHGGICCRSYYRSRN